MEREEYGEKYSGRMKGDKKNVEILTTTHHTTHIQGVSGREEKRILTRRQGLIEELEDIGKKPFIHY